MSWSRMEEFRISQTGSTGSRVSPWALAKTSYEQYAFTAQLHVVELHVVDGGRAGLCSVLVHRSETSEHRTKYKQKCGHNQSACIPIEEVIAYFTGSLDHGIGGTGNSTECVSGDQVWDSDQVPSMGGHVHHD